jgi:hypothetical protein
MGMRAGRLVAAFVVTLFLAMPASAMGAIDILGRGFTPDPAVVNGTATIDVEVKVGQAPYIIEFICCDVLKTDTPTQTLDESSPQTQGLTGRHQFKFNVGGANTNATDRTVTIRVTDSNGDQNTQRFTFKAPTPPAPPPPPPDSGPENLNECPTVVSFGLIRARTTAGNCWRKQRAPAAGYSSSGVKVDGRGVFYETSGRFTLNGVPFPAAPSGSAYLLAEPTSSAPGGQIGLDKTVELKLGTITVFKQPLLWKLPTGSSEGTLAAFSLPTGQLAGLPIGGQIEVVFRKRGTSFATSFPIQVTLPSIFKPSPGTVGTITGATEITTDDQKGVSLDGGKIQVENAAIGKLALKQLCFSYLSANASTRFAACEPPSLDGAPAVSCAPPTQRQERFDGGLQIQLPTARETEFAAYGGIAGGKFAYGGGFVDNAGIPLVAGITLERVGFGLCVQPSITIRGDAGFGFAQGLVRGNVSLTYSETGVRSFFVEVAGNVNVATIPIGNARVKVDSTGSIDFDVGATMLLAGGFVQINGGIAGFVRPRPFAFQADGKVQLCLDLKILGKPCATATGTVSNIGAGGCADFGFIGQFSGFFLWKVPPAGQKRFDVGKGCGFQNRVKVQRKAWKAGGPLTFPVPANSPQYVVHFKGAGGRAPKVKITSPSGAVIQSGTDTVNSDQRTFLLLENEDETSVFLQEDAAPGNWQVEAIGGTSITDIEFQGAEPNPTVLQGTVKKSGDKRTLDYAWSLRSGDKVTLDVIGEGFQQTIATGLTGKPCTGGKSAPGKTPAQSRCAQLTWTAKFGFAGARDVQATVVDASGAIVDRKVVARFSEAAPKTAPRVPQLRMVRKGRSVFAIWGAAGGNTSRYGAYAVLSDGRRIGHAAPANCLAWKIDKVAPTTSVVLRLQSGRQDLRFGPAGSLTLKGKQAYAGPAKLKSAPIPRPCQSL